MDSLITVLQGMFYAPIKKRIANSYLAVALSVFAAIGSVALVIFLVWLVATLLHK